MFYLKKAHKLTLLFSITATFIGINSFASPSNTKANDKEQAQSDIQNKSVKGFAEEHTTESTGNVTTNSQGQTVHSRTYTDENGGEVKIKSETSANENGTTSGTITITTTPAGSTTSTQTTIDMTTEPISDGGTKYSFQNSTEKRSTIIDTDGNGNVNFIEISGENHSLNAQKDSSGSGWQISNKSGTISGSLTENTTTGVVTFVGTTPQGTNQTIVITPPVLAEDGKIRTPMSITINGEPYTSKFQQESQAINNTIKSTLNAKVERHAIEQRRDDRHEQIYLAVYTIYVLQLASPRL